MFDKFLCQENVISKEITEEIYDSWVESFRDLNKDSTIYHKISNIISLLKYMYNLSVGLKPVSSPIFLLTLRLRKYFLWQMVGMTNA